MGNPTGFLKYNRELPDTASPDKRVKHYREFYNPFDKEKLNKQAARCMDCGVPFCHSGCPLGNNIPEFNDAVYRDDWEAAIDILHSTNNFPEFTGRICPAPCEASCVLAINKPAVTIELIEKMIAEEAFKRGLIKPQPPEKRSGKKVAVIGSGPAGMAAAAQLNKAGHMVTVFERDDRIGGLLRYGIPDFKMEKHLIDRRLEILEAEGIQFKTNAYIGQNVDAKKLAKDYDAVVLCTGSTVPRDLPVPGRELKGVHFAMEFLTRQNKKVAGDKIPSKEDIIATGKNVVVIGGGDTGSDCIGTSNRHEAKSIVQFELLGKPIHERTPENPWPEWPMTMSTTSSHEEGADRKWSILTKKFVGDKKGNLTGVKVVNIEWIKEKGKRPGFKEIKGSERVLPCELALLAIGYIHTEKHGMLETLGVQTDDRGNIATNAQYQTNIPHIFSAGDNRRGQSLVVWAISEGREAAKAVDEYLMGESVLEGKGESWVNI